MQKLKNNKPRPKFTGSYKKKGRIQFPNFECIYSNDDWCNKGLVDLRIKFLGNFF